MASFSLVISRGEIEIDVPLRAPPTLAASQQEAFCSRYWRLATSWSGKFPDERVFKEDEEFLLAIVGIVLNDEELKRETVSESLFTAVKTLYRKGGWKSLKHWRGEFCGVLLDKRADRWVVFTSQSGSRPAFYYQDADYLVCASALPGLHDTLARLGRRCGPDLDGAYCLLTYGFMIEDLTLLSGVKKIQAGKCLVWSNQRATRETYYQLDNAERNPGSRREALDTINSLFRQAVQRGFRKDVKYGYKSASALSAGLDSRMIAFVAADLGFHNVLHVNYAQSGSYDEQIPREIARHLGHELVFYPLDGGQYLTRTIEDMVCANGGLILYSGASHMLSACRNLNFDRLGIYYSGMIGDAFFGSFLEGPRQVSPQADHGAYSQRLLSRINGVVKDALRRYENAEMYLFGNRAFNGAQNGTWVGNQFTHMYSPFLDPDFMDYLLSLPAALRWDGELYLDWICGYYPAAAKERWGHTGLPVRYSRKGRWLLERIQRTLKRALPSRTMNPFGYWYAHNRELRDYCRCYFSENIKLLASHAELSRDATQLFEEGTLIEKTQVMTLLQAYRVYFA